MIHLWFRSHYQLPDFFSVYIPASDNGEMTAKRLIVEIINKPIVKPFLGGYIHKKTCDFNDSFKILMYNKPLTQFINLCKSRFMHKVIEYHDACSQTGPIIDAAKANRLMTRDTQTTEWQSLLGVGSYFQFHIISVIFWIKSFCSIHRNHPEVEQCKHSPMLRHVFKN